MKLKNEKLINEKNDEIIARMRKHPKFYENRIIETKNNHIKKIYKYYEYFNISKLWEYMDIEISLDEFYLLFDEDFESANYYLVRSITEELEYVIEYIILEDDN